MQHVERIEAIWPEAEVVNAGQERIADELPHADIYCGHAKVPVPWEAIVKQQRLQWIQSSAAGLDHCLVPSVIDSSIPVTSASGVLAKQVADQTFALLAGMLRNLPAFFRAKERREFIRLPTKDLYGATVGIVGVGGNGRVLARILQQFEATILATDWYPDEQHKHVDELYPADQLDEILPRVDILILTAPLNEHTRGMIDERRLRLMREDAVLINVARGPLIVESDLAKVLKDGHLWGAGIDVTEVEPLAEDSPLWEIPNLIITPHVGGQRASRLDDSTDLFCENLRRFRADEPLVNLVDKKLGFPEPSAIWTR